MPQFGHSLVGPDGVGGEVVVEGAFGEDVAERVHVGQRVRGEDEHVLVGADVGRGAVLDERAGIGLVGEGQPLGRAPVGEEWCAALHLDRQPEVVDHAGLADPRGGQHDLGREQVERTPLVLLAPPAPVVRPFPDQDSISAHCLDPQVNVDERNDDCGGATLRRFPRKGTGRRSPKGDRSAARTGDRAAQCAALSVCPCRRRIGANRRPAVNSPMSWAGPSSGSPSCWSAH